MPKCQSRRGTGPLRNTMCIPACVAGSLEYKQPSKQMQMLASRRFLSRGAPRSHEEPPRPASPLGSEGLFYLFVSRLDGPRNSQHQREHAEPPVGIAPPGGWELGEVGRSRSAVPDSCFPSVQGDNI